MNIGIMSILLKNKYADYDGWLNKYQSIWENAKNIIDLGCGCGVNSIFFSERGIDVLPCDFSEIALSLVKAQFQKAQTMRFDMSEIEANKYEYKKYAWEICAG